MLQSFNAANRLPLATAPRAWIERAASLAQNESVLKRTVRILADLVFDSWAVPHPVGVRGEAATDHRRLRFESPALTFDFHAEHRKTDWVLVAQVTGPDADLTKILIGSKTILPDSAGIYQWSAKRPPKKISLVTGQGIVDLPELIWKKTKIN